ncbi:DUF4142 domain-containing protein [Flavivirga sp. 57AJ16]|uniref:DUF4142 domain-containing protein n=1 Tax=Flavivirga sp. 57AJ16 TaxID=3025307 RepID=UPI002366057B|nr:DUF4142 domain-containing protein [Flavivirga sp. 57AJ16]MDD7886619.1 DUF4142 domain-containing protein [Flavivirga sp. 57AJ16]
MKSQGNIKSIIIMISITSFVSTSLTSCDWMIVNNNHNKEKVFGINQNKVNTNKHEAKLLVMASQNNIDAVELCKLIRNSETEKDIKHLAKELQQTHIKIFNDYKELAQEKLISIPQHYNIEYGFVNAKLEKNKDDKLVKDYLKHIVQKINNQIELLNKLSKTTNNKAFSELSKKTNPILKLELIKTKDMLKKLEMDKKIL